MASDWPKNGQKGTKMQPGSDNAPPVILPMAMVRAGLKISALVRGSYLGGRSHRR